MTREEKKAKKLARAAFRRKKRTEIYLRKINAVNKYQFYIPISAVDNFGNIIGCWSDSNSKTGSSQLCDWEEQGKCDCPCNGDC
jgi:hypothetical protein